MTAYEPGIHNIRGIQDIFSSKKHLDIEDLSFQAKVGYRETEIFILKLGDWMGEPCISVGVWTCVVYYDI